MLKRSPIGECKVHVRALSIKCSHRRAGEGLQSNVKITHGDLLSLNACVCECVNACRSIFAGGGLCCSCQCPVSSSCL